jgi:hypothetical protein
MHMRQTKTVCLIRRQIFFSLRYHRTENMVAGAAPRSGTHLLPPHHVTMCCRSGMHRQQVTCLLCTGPFAVMVSSAVSFAVLPGLVCVVWSAVPLCCLVCVVWSGLRGCSVGLVYVLASHRIPTCVLSAVLVGSACGGSCACGLVCLVSVFRCRTQSSMLASSVKQGLAIPLIRWGLTTL